MKPKVVAEVANVNNRKTRNHPEVNWQSTKAPLHSQLATN